MVIDGTKKVAIEWLSDGELLIAQGNKVLQLSPRQAAELMAELISRDDPAIKNELGAIEATNRGRK